MARHAFILGGTGQIGHATAIDLLDHGWKVTLSCRGKVAAPEDLVARGVSIITFDREQPQAFASALASGADAVIDTVAYTSDHAKQLLEVQDSVGAYVVISSASVYRDEAGRTLNQTGETGFPDFPNPITEAQATVEPGPETYSARKVALERWLLDHARKPVTVLRPCAIHGIPSVHPREWWFVKRMLDRRSVIPVAYGGRSRFHTSATANIAALIRTVLGQASTRILNIGDSEPLTVEEIGRTIAGHMGFPGLILPLDIGDNYGNAAIGGTPWSVPKPFTLDMEAAHALGYEPTTSYEHAVGKMCEWLVAAQGPDWKTSFPVLAAYPEDLFDYAAEDKYLADFG